MSLGVSTWFNKRKFDDEDERDRHQEVYPADMSQRNFADFQRFQNDEKRGGRGNNRRQRQDNRKRESFYDSQPRGNQD